MPPPPSPSFSPSINPKAKSSLGLGPKSSLGPNRGPNPNLRPRRARGLRAAGLLCLAWLASLAPVPALAAQLGLVVGIDRYRHGADNPRGDQVRNLQGAVNDARLIREALRRAGVDVPDARVLLDGAATRAGVLAAWRAMVEAARPGDTLVFAYSGHGGQEEEFAAPRDEADGYDETLMLADFDPKQPLLGRISDDELVGLFRAAADHRILFVADTCHAAGLNRSVRPGGVSRFGGQWPVSSGARRPPDGLTAVADDAPLSHVTHLLANDAESREIQEVAIEGRAHGALSWNFAQALGGAAEQARDGVLTRQELGDYLHHTVRSATENLQTPRILPMRDATPVLTLARSSPAPAAPGAPSVLAHTRGIEPPAGLSDVQWVEAGWELAFESMGGGAMRVRNRVGDAVASGLPAGDRAAWQRVIAGARLMQAIDARNRQETPARIALREGDAEHVLGAVLSFQIDAAAGGRAALTLFNLSGNGELQYLYPVTEAGIQDPPEVALPFALPPVRVTGPVGGETLAAVLCERPPAALQGRLRRAAHESLAPGPEEFLGALGDGPCRMARYPWFSRERP